MTLNDAEKIVQQYGNVLARKIAIDEPAYCVSLLRHSPQRIVQAMKLCLAHKVWSRSLTEEYQNGIESAASMLSHFIDNEEARRLNAIGRGKPERTSAASMLSRFIDNEETRRLNAITRRMLERTKRESRSADDIARDIAEAKAYSEVMEWQTAALGAGLLLRAELTAFITEVEHFDPSDPLYWQRVYTLLGIEHSVAKKHSFWSWFS